MLSRCGVALPSKFYRGRGCDRCGKSGLRGRCGIYELLEVTDGVRNLMFRDPGGGEIEALARSEGMRTLLEDGLLKVEAGLTPLREVLRVAY